MANENNQAAQDAEWGGEGIPPVAPAASAPPPASPQQETPPAAPPATTAPQQPPPPAELREDELPEGLKEAFALLAEIEHTPAKTPQQQREKADAIAKVKAHIAVLQNGKPAPLVSANDKAKASKRHAQVTKEARWQYLARNNNVAAEMFEEIKRLRSQLSKSKTKK